MRITGILRSHQPHKLECQNPYEIFHSNRVQASARRYGFNYFLSAASSFNYSRAQEALGGPSRSCARRMGPQWEDVYTVSPKAPSCRVGNSSASLPKRTTLWGHYRSALAAARGAAAPQTPSARGVTEAGTARSRPAPSLPPGKSRAGPCRGRPRAAGTLAGGRRVPSANVKGTARPGPATDRLRAPPIAAGLRGGLPSAPRRSRAPPPPARPPPGPRRAAPPRNGWCRRLPGPGRRGRGGGGGGCPAAAAAPPAWPRAARPRRQPAAPRGGRRPGEAGKRPKDLAAGGNEN